MPNPAAQFQEILHSLKGLTKAFHETGVGPVRLSPEVLSFLDEYLRPAAPRTAPAHGPARDIPRPKGPDMDSLGDLARNVANCTLCPLHRSRKNTVFGEGNSRARLIFIGEAPGEEEDQAGRPFVGPSGKLLTRIIENGMGLNRKDVYICNVVKCHPPQNRDPEPKEMEACLPFLERQIRLIGPEVICTLGRVAGVALFGSGFGIKTERGQWRTFMGIPLMPTFHPAHLLRTPQAKRETWEDIQQVMAHLGLEVQKRG